MHQSTGIYNCSYSYGKLDKLAYQQHSPAFPDSVAITSAGVSVATGRLVDDNNVKDFDDVGNVFPAAVMSVPDVVTAAADFTTIIMQLYFKY